MAAEIELPFSEFWDMTPYELNLKARAYFDRQEREHKDKITLEYYNAMWTIQWLGKKSQQPKPLEKILDGLFKQKKIMTDDEMLAQVMILNNIFGGEVKEK